MKGDLMEVIPRRYRAMLIDCIEDFRTLLKELPV